MTLLVPAKNICILYSVSFCLFLIEFTHLGYYHTAFVAIILKRLSASSKGLHIPAFVDIILNMFTSHRVTCIIHFSLFIFNFPSCPCSVGPVAAWGNSNWLSPTDRRALNFLLQRYKNNLNLTNKIIIWAGSQGFSNCKAQKYRQLQKKNLCL